MTTKTTYTIEHVEGYSHTPHFGHEIAVSLVNRQYADLQAARCALKTAKANHRRVNGRATGYDQGRFDIVLSGGHRLTWE